MLAKHHVSMKTIAKKSERERRIKNHRRDIIWQGRIREKLQEEKLQKIKISVNNFTIYAVLSGNPSVVESTHCVIILDGSKDVQKMVRIQKKNSIVPLRRCYSFNPFGTISKKCSITQYWSSTVFFSSSPSSGSFQVHFHNHNRINLSPLKKASTHDFASFFCPSTFKRIALFSGPPQELNCTLGYYWMNRGDRNGSGQLFVINFFHQGWKGRIKGLGLLRSNDDAVRKVKKLN